MKKITIIKKIIKMISILVLIFFFKNIIFADSDKEESFEFLYGGGIALITTDIQFPYLELGYKLYRVKITANFGNLIIIGEYGWNFAFKIFEIYKFDNSLFISSGSDYLLSMDEGDSEKYKFYGLGYEIKYLPSNLYLRLSYRKYSDDYYEKYRDDNKEYDNNFSIQELFKSPSREIFIHIGLQYSISYGKFN